LQPVKRNYCSAIIIGRQPPVPALDNY